MPHGRITGLKIKWKGKAAHLTLLVTEGPIPASPPVIETWWKTFRASVPVVIDRGAVSLSLLIDNFTSQTCLSSIILKYLKKKKFYLFIGWLELIYVSECWRPLLGKYWWHFIKAKVRIVGKVLCCYHGDNEGLSVINHSSYERSQSLKMTISRKLHQNDYDFYFSRQTIRLFLYK